MIHKLLQVLSDGSDDEQLRFRFESWDSLECELFIIASVDFLQCQRLRRIYRSN